MGTLKDYYISDNKHKIKTTNQNSLNIENKNGDKFDIDVQLFFDFASGAKYYSYFIPFSENLIKLIDFVTSNKIIEQVSNWGTDYTIKTNFPYERDCISQDLVFCRCIYFYLENKLTSKDRTDLNKVLIRNNIRGEFRDEAWMKESLKRKKPLAFISHDFQDKSNVARPFAQKLAHRANRTIWYDEFTLTVGDKLRREIEKGIRQSEYCILLLTKNYLLNESWANIEFESIFTKELIEKKDSIIPIWINITKEELYEFCPSLINIWGLNWNIGIENIVNEILKKVGK